MNIDSTLCFCDQVRYVILKTSCQTNFRCTRLQFRGMGPVWSLLLHVITSLSPKCLKSIGKMKKTDFFPQNQNSDNPGQKSLGHNIHIFLLFLGSLFNIASFPKFSCSSPFPHPIQSWNSEKILDTRVPHCLWGEGRGIGLVWTGNQR